MTTRRQRLAARPGGWARRAWAAATIMAGAIAAFAVAGTGLAPTHAQDAVPSEIPTPAPQERVAPSSPGLPPASPEIERILAGMSLEAKVGQTMVVAFAGDTPTADVLGLIDDLRVGGVILFQDNVGRGSPDRVRAMVAGLQARAVKSGSSAPLLVAVDQEGGPVVRVGEAATLFPGAMALGATSSEALVARASAAVARELRGLGINVNLGPVVDVNSNPANPVIGTRSFGADPVTVGRLGASAIRAQQAAGVLAIAKHWPGHGDASIDSHLELPLLNLDRRRLDAIESPPFRAAVEAGVAGVMTAHLDVPVLTSGDGRAMPASLSPRALGELRALVGDNRLIVSDDLEMGAVVDRFGTAGAAVRAFGGGTDLLLFRRDSTKARQAHAEMVEAVRRGAIPVSRLDDAVRRVLRAKLAVGLFGDPIVDATATESASVVAADVAKRSITVIQTRPVLPLWPGADDRVCVVQPRRQEIASQEIVVPVIGPATLGEAFGEEHGNVKVVDVGLAPTAPERAAAAACARNASIAVVGTYEGSRYPRQRELVAAVAAEGGPTIIVALRSPYDYGAVNASVADAFITGYSMRPASLRAIVRTIFGIGDSAPTGRLPVPLDDAHPVGWSYELKGTWQTQ
jgi:beta-N-acetylhexosaminidase